MAATETEREKVKREREIGNALEAKAKAKAKAEKQIEIELNKKTWDDDGVCHPAGVRIKISATAAKRLVKAGAAHIPIPDDD